MDSEERVVSQEHGGVGIANLDRIAYEELTGLSPSLLLLLDRQLTAAMRAVWAARGIQKDIFKVDDDGNPVLR